MANDYHLHQTLDLIHQLRETVGLYVGNTTGENNIMNQTAKAIAHELLHRQIHVRLATISQEVNHAPTKEKAEEFAQKIINVTLEKTHEIDKNNKGFNGLPPTLPIVCFRDIPTSDFRFHAFEATLELIKHHGILESVQQYFTRDFNLEKLIQSSTDKADRDHAVQILRGASTGKTPTYIRFPIDAGQQVDLLNKLKSFIQNAKNE